MADNKNILFDVNEGVSENLSDITAKLPNLDMVSSPQEYANFFTSLSRSSGKSILEIAKGFGTPNMPPSAVSFARMNYMPTQTAEFGILQWPGFPAATLEKLAREHISIQMMLAIRVDDVLRYALPSKLPWRPGWQIKPRPGIEITTSIRKEIHTATEFLLNGGLGPAYENPRERDDLGRMHFSKYLAETTRNSLTYDGLAVWTEFDDNKKILSFTPYPAQNIRLVARENNANTSRQNSFLNLYVNNSIPKVPTQQRPHWYAVAVDDTENIIDKFTRYELIFYARNPRVDPYAQGYGYSEIEIALTLINGFTNAIKFNADLFDKNAIPKGFLALKGNFSQRQLDTMGRIWDNLQRGVNNMWSLPAIQLNEKGSIEVISLEELRKEPIYYSNLINLFIGVLSVVYRIPVHRFGFKASGTERDSRPDTPKSIMEEEDIGLPVLLTHHEIIVNDYILKSRWPLLEFQFTGKSPKEDARLYEARMLSMSLKEKREMMGDGPWVDLATDEEEKKVARWMDLAPVDPALTGIYQSIMNARAKEMEAKSLGGGGKTSGPTDTPGANFTSKKDPAKSESQGHMSGVRRDSAAESVKQRQGRETITPKK